MTCVYILPPPRLSGERKTSYLEDIAILTGGQLVKDELGITLDKADESVLGLAAKVVVGKESCTIVGDGRTQVRGKTHSRSAYLLTHFSYAVLYTHTHWYFACMLCVRPCLCLCLCSRHMHTDRAHTHALVHAVLIGLH